ncbi:DUF1802 family protein [Paenibacillus sp. GSMTC-2017]|uniref:DUF1802 family protein n=1 Tax=Paenibacillus sp. GSMTC-2017 TaxID=2794350 RepID=UPI0018D94274|nr:DUF1802 family protein [Paenibacillus sp. GSMTC-2017]MBH5318539.1 DUF1802 family protein [Paenibacillus sp. GSMTC-2017]
MSEQQVRQAIALKEWAVSVKALLDGKQIIIMRKGGIIEETRDFELMSNRFYLMPAYEHQKKHLLKEDYRDEIDDTIKEWSAHKNEIKLEAYAEVVQDIEINDQETLDKLRHLHIWTDTFAEERLKWKRKKPLHLLLLKIYKLDEPVFTPIRDTYNGCKSWVRLEDEIPLPAMTSVLSEEQLAEEIVRIKQALEE